MGRTKSRIRRAPNTSSLTNNNSFSTTSISVLRPAGFHLLGTNRFDLPPGFSPPGQSTLRHSTPPPGVSMCSCGTYRTSMQCSFLLRQHFIHSLRTNHFQSPNSVVEINKSSKSRQKERKLGGRRMLGVPVVLPEVIVFQYNQTACLHAARLVPQLCQRRLFVVFIFGELLSFGLLCSALPP